MYNHNSMNCIQLTIMCMSSKLDKFYALYFSVVFLFATDNQDLLRKEPRSDDLQRCLIKMADKWRDLGDCLGVESGTLGSLAHDLSMSDTTRLMGVFHKWDNSRCSSHTFEKLISCLEIIEMNKYIEKITDMLEKNRAHYSKQPDYSEDRTA